MTREVGTFNPPIGSFGTITRALRPALSLLSCYGSGGQRPCWDLRVLRPAEQDSNLRCPIGNPTTYRHCGDGRTRTSRLLLRAALPVTISLRPHWGKER